MYTRLTGIHRGSCSNFVASPHQKTPLYQAAAKGHVDTVQYLIEAGGDIHSKDDEGVSE